MTARQSHRWLTLALARLENPTWTPSYNKWRHGGWYVNVSYPSGAVGCVSNNYPDRKWRIVCDPRPDAHEKHIYRSRAEAAQAERELCIELLRQALSVTPEGSPEVRDAGPGEARLCPACGAWIFTAFGPFESGDRTKTLADANHWMKHHAGPIEPEPGMVQATSFPLMPFNDETVEAIVERPEAMR